MNIGACLRGQFSVEIYFRGKKYCCMSNNTLAYDCIRSNDEGLVYYSSVKQALLALWNECKAKNSLR